MKITILKKIKNEQGKLKLKFIIIPTLVLLVMYMAFAQTSYITPLAMNISIGDAFAIFVDITNNRVGINNSIPNSTLHVSGDANITGELWVSGKNVTAPDVQIFTDTSQELTWTKPSAATTVYIELIGAGGGGGSQNGVTAGGGGGGGALVRGIYNADDLPATLKIWVGSGGLGTHAGQVGEAGENTYVNSTTDFNLTAYGGGGGGAGAGAQDNGGGGGGGTGSAGGSGNGVTAGDGGLPDISGSTQGNSLGGRGAKGGEAAAGSNAEFGGGGGGGGSRTSVAGFAGGSSIFAAGGGGGGGGGGTEQNGAGGGAWGSYSAGGGGAAGIASGGDGGDGTNRNYGAGDGGGGGAGGTGGNGGGGGEGGIPGGGGGGMGGEGGTPPFSSGNGARGEVRIFSW